MLGLHGHDLLMGAARLRPTPSHLPLRPSSAARRRAARPTRAAAAAAADANGDAAADAATASAAPAGPSSSSPYVFKLGDGDVIFVRPPRRDVGPSWMTWEEALQLQLAALRHNDRAIPPPPPAAPPPPPGDGGSGEAGAAAEEAAGGAGAPGDAAGARRQHRHPDHGIEVLYRFADFSPFERADYFGRSLDLGQFERFRRVVHSPHFRPLLGHARAVTLSTLRLGERCWRARVEVVGSDGGSSSGLVAPERRVYEWTLVRRLGGVHDGTWFTRSLVAEGNDWSDVLAM